MIVREQTLQELQSNGIVAKIYPDDYESFYRRCVENRFKWLSNYDDAVTFVDGAWLKEKDRPGYLEEKQRDAEKYALKDVNNWYDSDTLYVEYDGRLIIKKISRKSELITKEYVLKLIEKDKKLYQGAYGEFTIRLKELLKEEGYDKSINVYPTTYGIGVFIFWWNGDAHIDKVKRILDTRGIEYHNEYSDAKWVYRFKVSKSKENISKIK